MTPRPLPIPSNARTHGPHRPHEPVDPPTDTTAWRPVELTWRQRVVRLAVSRGDRVTELVQEGRE